MAISTRASGTAEAWPGARVRSAAAIHGLRKLARNPGAAVGLALVLAFTAMAVFAPWIAPKNPNLPDVKNRVLPPGAAGLMGTDEFGRDVFSRVVYGSRISMEVGFWVVFWSAIPGTVLGLVSGHYGGRLDNVIMRFMDALMAFPGLLLALAVMAALGPSKRNIILALAIVYTPSFARLVRGAALSVAQYEFIEAARAGGAPDRVILFRHLLPNTLSPLMVNASVTFAYAILSEAALSFLGLGVPQPAPSWGNILADGRKFIYDGAWMSVFPGIAIALLVLGVNLLGDALRDLTDPRLRGLDR